MSGIAGAFFADGRPAQPECLRRMLAAMAHRGPDGAAVWCDGSVGLGHLMLRSTPEAAHESLPLVETARRLAITADARLDNREELIRLLSPVPRAARPVTDAELILAAYERWDTACVERLLGDFAFAIWDGRQERIFCARDHAGVRPFCYHRSTGGAFVFASEIKALLQLEEVPRRLNETRLADYLVGAHLDREYTFFEDIARLPAGHWMVVERHGSRIGSYWSPDPSRELRLGSDGEYAEAFREIFTEAVRCRLRSADPVAAMLSGGLDSSSIVCVARGVLQDAGREPLLTFSTVFEQLPACDESPYIHAVLAGHGCRPHFISFDHERHRPIRDVRDTLRFRDEPVFAPNVSQSWQLSRTIGESAARVVLDGHGGDETVSHGYGYLKELARAKRWVTLARELRGVSQAGPDSFGSLLSAYVSFGMEPTVRRSRPLRLTRRVWRAGKREVARRLAPRASTSAPSRLDLVAPELARRTGVAERFHAWRRAGASFESERQEHWKAVSSALPAAAFDALDAQAAAFGLEARYPFWDRRLVEFCLALPPEQKRSGGWGRMILRRAMDGVLPTAVQWRAGKTDFTPSITVGLRRNESEELRRLTRSIAGVAEYVNVEAFTGACGRLLSGDTAVQDYYALARASTLLYWLEEGNGRLLTWRSSPLNMAAPSEDRGARRVMEQRP